MKSKSLLGSLLDSNNDRSSRGVRKRLIFWTTILLAAIFLYLALRGLDWQAFRYALRNADYEYLPLLFLWNTFSYLVRAIRWRTLLTAEKQIPLLKVFSANMAGYLGNNILPARAGEFIRAAYLGKQNKISTSFVFATGLVEHLVDVIALIVLGGVSLSMMNILSSPIRVALQTMSAIGICGLLVILLLPHFGTQLSEIITALTWLGQSTRSNLAGLLSQFLRGLETLHQFQRIVFFILLTGLIWMIDGFGTVFLSHILHLSLSLGQAFVLLAGLGLSSAIPSTPGYVGVYQFVAVAILEPFGTSSAEALAFILFMQIINMLALSLWGIIALLNNPLRSPSGE